MPSPVASRICAVCANTRSLNRHAMTLPTQEASTNAAWIAAHVHGDSYAAGWL